MSRQSTVVISPEVRNLLDRGLNELAISVSEKQLNQLILYVELLLKWGAVYNLTAIRDPKEVITHHLLDALSVVSHFERVLQAFDVSSIRVVDVGSGGGIPVIPLAILFPDVKFVACDRVQKKCAFLRQAAIELKLSLGVFDQAIQLWADDLFDVAICRAFASVHDFLSWTNTVMAPSAVWLAMKGRDQDIENIPPGFSVVGVHSLAVPMLNESRHLIEIGRMPLSV